MIGYLGVVTKVLDNGLRAEVKFMLPGMASRALRVGSPIGLVARPVVGDEVAVLPTGSGLEDAVIVCWFPTTNEATGKRIVVSDDDELPTSTEEGSPIGNADLADDFVLAREIVPEPPLVAEDFKLEFDV